MDVIVFAWIVFAWSTRYSAGGIAALTQIKSNSTLICHSAQAFPVGILAEFRGAPNLATLAAVRRLAGLPGVPRQPHPEPAVIVD
ncbi:MAG: hypothetical protein ACREFB_15160 [Stellaceae bacterium]